MQYNGITLHPVFKDVDQKNTTYHNHQSFIIEAGYGEGIL